MSFLLISSHLFIHLGFVEVKHFSKYQGLLSQPLLCFPFFLCLSLFFKLDYFCLGYLKLFLNDYSNTVSLSFLLFILSYLCYSNSFKIEALSCCYSSPKLLCLFNLYWVFEGLAWWKDIIQKDNVAVERVKNWEEQLGFGCTDVRFLSTGT